MNYLKKIITKNDIGFVLKNFDLLIIYKLKGFKNFCLWLNVRKYKPKFPVVRTASWVCISALR